MLDKNGLFKYIYLKLKGVFLSKNLFVLYFVNKFLERIMKLYKNLATILLAVTFVAAGQQSTSEASELEKTIAPVKSTLEHDARLASSATKTMKEMDSSLRKAFQTVKKGPRTPTDFDKAFLARQIEAYANQAALCSSLHGTFEMHSALLNKKVIDFLEASKVRKKSSEEKALLTAVTEMDKWLTALHKSIPEMDSVESMKLIEEVLAYVKPPKPK
jgi:hypothetical protein